MYIRQKIQPDPVLFSAVIILVCLGLVAVYSSSAMVSYAQADEMFLYLKRQAFWAILGTGAMVMAMRVPYQKWQKTALPLLVISLLLLLLVMVPQFGKTVYGARRWLKFGPLVFQPVELAKLSVVIYLADTLTRKQMVIKRFFRTLVPALLVLGVFSVLLLKQPDLGSTVIIVSIGVFMFFIAGVRLSQLAALGVSSVPVIYHEIISAPYRLQRLKSFIDPWADPRNDGFQMVQSFLALGSGGIFGVGLGNSQQKFFYLPTPHTDFIFSIIGEEFGFIGAGLIVALFLCVVWRGMRIATMTEEMFGRLLAAGITVMIGIQAIINIGVVTGSLPTKGTTLPFISYGGSALLLNMTAIGILLNISRKGARN